MTIIIIVVIKSQDAEVAKTFNEFFYKYPNFKYAKQQSFFTQTRSFEKDSISGII